MDIGLIAIAIALYLSLRYLSEKICIAECVKSGRSSEECRTVCRN